MISSPSPHHAVESFLRRQPGKIVCLNSTAALCEAFAAEQLSVWQANADQTSLSIIAAQLRRIADAMEQSR